MGRSCTKDEKRTVDIATVGMETTSIKEKYRKISYSLDEGHKKIMD